MILPTPIHPAIVHFPIALLILASVCGLLYCFWRPHPTLRTLTWWPMAIGWAATLIAILSGFVDQRMLAPDAPFRAILNRHIGSGLALWVLYALILYQHWLFSQPSRQLKRERKGNNAESLLDDPDVRLRLALGLALGIGLVIFSGWQGGQLVYKWGVNVLQVR